MTEQMPAKTKQAILDSVDKWEERVDGDHTWPRPSNCPLCQVFYASEFGPCHNCPVKQKTGHPYCRETPEQEYENAYNNYKDHRTLTKIAQAEVDFLGSLLPEED